MRPPTSPNSDVPLRNQCRRILTTHVGLVSNGTRYLTVEPVTIRGWAAPRWQWAAFDGDTCVRAHVAGWNRQETIGAMLAWLHDGQLPRSPWAE